MYTIKNSRRKGLAKQLLEMVMKEAKASGCGQFILWHQKWAQSFMKAVGSNATGIFFSIIFINHPFIRENTEL